MKTALGWLWCLPWSVLGFVLVVVPFGYPGFYRAPGLIFEAGPWLAWFFRFIGWNAFTWGVVAVVKPAAAERTIAHELEHVRQGMRWGLFFPIAYLVAWGIAVARGKSRRECYFEAAAVKAGAAMGPNDLSLLADTRVPKYPGITF